MKVRQMTAAVLIGLLVLAATILLAGCGAKRQDVSVRPYRSSGPLTPLKRGQLRTRLVGIARQGLETWRVSDVDGMKKYFASDLVRYYSVLKAKYAREGKVRVRSHDVTFLDLLELNDKVTQASITYRFTNNSYFKDKRTGRVLSRDKKGPAEIDLTLEKKPGGWKIVRVFGAGEVMK